MSKFLSGTLRKLLVGITGYTENKTVIQTTGKVGIGTTDAQQHSLFVVGSTNITGDTIVGGGLTAVGIGSFQSDVYIDNQLFVGGVNITGGASVGEDITTRNLKATGISTFVGIATVESTLFTNQLSVSGVSTFVGAIDANGDLDVDGHTELDNVNISGVTTFVGAIDANGDLDVDGHTELDNVNISGVTTFVGAIDANGGLTANEATVEDLTNDRIVIVGVGGRLEDSANLTFDGVTLNVVGHTEVDRLNVSGIATFSGNIDANGDLDVDGQTELDNVNVSGIATIQNLDVQGDFDVYDTEAVFHNNVYIAGNLGIGGTATVITAQDLQVFDRDIILGITTDSNGEDISNDITANHGGVAVASTVGSPLVDLALAGFSDLPPTYKQLMWVSANSYGVGTTDAWHFNYAVGIGSTLVPNGTRFAVKEIQVTDNTIKTPNLNVTGVGTIAVLHAPSITPDGTDFGTSGYFPKANGSGGWEWADVPGLFSVNNILNGFNVSEEGSIVGTAGSITQLDFRGANIVATADPQPNGIATITMSDSPTFDNLTVSGTTQTQQINVTGVSTFQGAAGFGGNVTVTGVSTFVGVGTFNGDLYVGGDLYVRDDLVFDSFVAREINVTQSSNLQDLYVAGLSTFVGVATAQNTLFSKQLNVSGLSTFYDDVEILGSNKELYVQGQIRASNLHSNGTDLVIRGGGNTTAKPGFVLPNASGGDLQILGNTGGTGDIVVDTRNTGNIELKQNGNVQATIDSVGIAFTDNVQARFGTSQDLQIYHNATDSYIDNTNGDFWIRTVSPGDDINVRSADDITIQNNGGTNAAIFKGGAGAWLYYNGGLKFETTGYGVTVYDTIEAPQLNITGIASVGTAITMYGATGIVSATAFYGDGSNLSNTGATLSAAAGTQRLVLTSLTSGTMVDAATDSDLTFDANYNLLSVPSINVSTAATFGGSVNAGGTTGTDGQYLKSTGVGVTWASFPTLRTTGITTATDGQSSFNFAYNINFLDVFVNGVKLTSSEYVANNGSTIVLNSPAFADDIVEYVSYNTTSTGGSGGSGGATILNDLSDVTLTSLSAGEVLKYDGTKWINDTVSVGSVGAGGTWAVDTVGINTTKSVGIGTTAKDGYKLYVEGDARVTGILTVGPASVTIDGINNEVTVGTGITLYGNTGIISATSLNITGALSGDGSSLTGLTGASANTYGNGTAVPQITVDANGRITGISNVLISGGGGGGSSIIIKDDDSLVGTAGTINFGTGLTVSPVVDDAVTITGITTSNVRTSTLSVSGVSTSLGNLIIGDQSNSASELRVFSGGTDASPEYFKFGAVGRVGTIQLNDNATLGELSIKVRQGIALFGNTSHISVWAKGDGSGSLLYRSAEKLVTTNTGAVVTGILTATSFSGDGSKLTGIGVTVAGTWNLEGGDGTNYTISGPGLDGTQADPTIYVRRGQVYQFTNNTGGHPFQIQYEGGNTGGTAYSDGIINNNAGSGVTLHWNVHNDAPDVLYYQCTAHTNMWGKIIVLGDVVTEGTWTASAGVAQTLDTISGIANNDIKTAEYTVHIENGSNMQAQKVLVMQDGTTAYSQEYAIMHKSGLLVSMSATISGGNLLLQATPETGVSGTTTYRITRQTMR